MFKECSLTWIEVVDTGLKIGLGAFFGVGGTLLTLWMNHKHEINKISIERTYKENDEINLLYIDFSVQSHRLIEIFEYKSCDTTSSEYINYLTVFHKLQILSTDRVKAATTSTFNKVLVHIVANKNNEVYEHHDQLRDGARKSLAIFQAVTRAEYNESES
jgi:hypothetical protein